MLQEADSESVSGPSFASSSSESSKSSGLLQLAAATAASSASADVHHKVFDTASSAYTTSNACTTSNSNKTGESGKLTVVSKQSAPLPSLAAPSSSSHDRSPLILEFLRDRGINVVTLKEVDAETMLDMMPTDAKGQTTSMGSLIHFSDQCSPCLFHMRDRCKKSWQCTYCHLPHRELSRQSRRLRPSKSTRLCEKARLLDQPTNATEDSGNFLQAQSDEEHLATNSDNEDTPMMVESHQRSRGQHRNLVSL